MVQAMKNRRTCFPFLTPLQLGAAPAATRGMAKKRHVGKSKLRLKRQRIETAGRFASVRFVISSDLHFNSRSSLACLSSACISLGMQLKAKFTPAVSSVQFLTKRNRIGFKKGFFLNVSKYLTNFWFKI